MFSRPDIIFFSFFLVRVCARACVCVGGGRGGGGGAG